MTAETAREIIQQALLDETWESAVPDDDEQALKDAAELVKMAEDAWEQNIRGPEVEAILKIAASDEDGAAPAKTKAKPKPAAKAKPGRPKPKAAEPEPEPAVDPRYEDEPWEDYDRNAVKEIVEGIEVWAEDDDHDSLLHIYLYEGAHKNRKNILAACVAGLPEDAIPTEDEEPEVEPEGEIVEDFIAEDDPEEWAEEPFDSYDTLKVADIKDALADFFENEDYSEEDKLATLGHVSHYEGAHKNRSGLLEYLEGIRAAYEEATGDDEEGEAPEEGEPEDAATPEADEDSAPRPARSKGRSKKAGTAAGAGASSNGAATYTVSADGSDDISVYSMNTAGALVVAMLCGGSTQVSVVASDG